MKIIKLIIIICFLKLKNTVTLFTYVRKRDIIGKKETMMSGKQDIPICSKDYWL